VRPDSVTRGRGGERAGGAEPAGAESAGGESAGVGSAGGEPAGGEIVTAERIAAALAASRERSLAYTDLDDDELSRQHSPLMSPLVWDLAHIGNYEDLWLVRAVTGAGPVRAGLDELYDAFRHPRADRPALPMLPPGPARDYVAQVRERTLDALAAMRADALALVPGDGVSREALDGRLLAGGFVYGMVVQHEHQHDETMLATHQLRAGPPAIADGGALPPGRPVPVREVLIPAGPFVMGTSTEPWAYDNERPAHTVDVPAFWIDTLPVSNAAHAAFIADGGYDEERLWSAAGWDWRQREGLAAPLFWRRDGGMWVRRRFGRDEPLPMDEPVQHVCWYEAQAHARWAGRRLPTEAEWEKACGWDPGAGQARRHPWGNGDATPERANLGHRAAHPAPLGAYPAGASAYGIQQMLGDVWEWTSSDFTGYPGFTPFPYREYSEVFFPHGADPHREYKVLRGGSWATDPAAARTTFRNWDHPIRRQIFAGFRLARDADVVTGRGAGR
jgi:gamma-glutamyl hercynylcysteine S-oxide synthase